ncbi:MAG TPA: hypothetical protein PK292_01865 [Termitinemataceae bacterium]|nr:hypothetical protein [Termitinemataceae bacterium]
MGIGLVLLLVLALSVESSCSQTVFLPFTLETEAGPISLISHSRGSAALELREGTISLAQPGEYVWTLQQPYTVTENLSIEIEYTPEYSYRENTEKQNAPRETQGGRAGLVSLKAGDARVFWELPLDFDTSREGSALITSIQYAIPLRPGILTHLTVRVTPVRDGAFLSAGKVKIRGIRLVPRWFGFRKEGQVLSLSPFVSWEGDTFVIRLSKEYQCKGPQRIEIQQNSTIMGTLRVHTFSYQGSGSFFIPWGALPEEASTFVYTASQSPRSVIVSSGLVPLPHPLSVDPAVILAYRQDRWRDSRYELFSWDRYPSILIFDMASYALQDRFFKRLAFFVEKKGFRGKLWKDEEIEEFRGWNAHDYRAEDLAQFFSVAAATAFPLNQEEQELRELLLANGIIQKGDDLSPYLPGRGAVLSIARGAEEYLRTLFLVHESFHGLFFIDPEFQEFAGARWKKLDLKAKRFLAGYFSLDSLQYDTANEYLMKNELMAYVLQQNVGAASHYFGSVLPSRLYRTGWGRSFLPPQDRKTGTWPLLARLFTAEAQAFNRFVQERYGLTAGKVWRLTIRRE